MCSNARGPAIEPSLVTWPIRKTGVPLVFASRRNCAATSRIWEIDPGADSISDEKVVWIESTIIAPGCNRSISRKIFSRFVSGRSSRFGAWTPRRSPTALRTTLAGSYDASYEPRRGLWYGCISYPRLCRAFQLWAKVRHLLQFHCLRRAVQVD